MFYNKKNHNCICRDGKSFAIIADWCCHRLENIKPSQEIPCQKLAEKYKKCLLKNKYSDCLDKLKFFEHNCGYYNLDNQQLIIQSDND